MRLKLSVATVAVVASVASTIGLAAAPAQARTLGFTEAYQAAVSQDARLRAARHAADAGREALPQARAHLMPSVSVGVGRSKNSLLTSTQAASGAGLTSYEGYYAGNKTLSLRQPLYRPALTANLGQARARVDESEATLEQEEQALAVRVAESYFELLLADEAVTLLQAQQRSHTTQLDAARKAYAAGSGVRTDIDEVRARLDLAEAQLVQARQHRLIAHRQLQAMVNEPFDGIAPIAPDALALAAPVPADLAAWLARAEAHSPEVHVARAQLDAARHEIAKARAGHQPTLDVVAEWGRNQSDNINRIGSRSTNKMLGLQFNLPLFAGGGTQSVVRQAIAEEQRASELLQALRSDLGIRVYREFAGVNDGVLRVRALEQAVRSAEQMVLSNRRSFQAGSRTTVDVLNAEEQHAAALRDLAQARCMYLMSQVRLAALTGGFDEQRLNQIGQSFTAGPAGAAPDLSEMHRAGPTGRAGAATP